MRELRSQEFLRNCGCERQCNVKILSFSPSTYSGSSTDITQVKCPLPSGGLLLVDMNNTSGFLFLYHSIMTKNINSNYDMESKIIRKTTEGFLWSQKGKTTLENEKKIDNS